MPFGNDTFNLAGGAVSDLLGGQQRAAGMRIQAGGMRVQAGGYRIQAEGNEMRARGDEAEAERYGLAGDLATQNATFTRESTAIQQMQAERALTLSLGSTTAGVGGSGFRMGGSALDILRDSASQGSLTHAVLGQQGLITEAGYKEEAKSYEVMKSAAIEAAGFERKIGAMTTDLAAQEDALADQTDALAKRTERDSRITAGIKAVAAVASIFTGLSLPSFGTEGNPENEPYGSNPFTPYGTRNPAYDGPSTSSGGSQSDPGVYGSNPFTPYGTRNPAYD